MLKPLKRKASPHFGSPSTSRMVIDSQQSSNNSNNQALLIDSDYVEDIRPRRNTGIVKSNSVKITLSAPMETLKRDDFSNLPQSLVHEATKRYTETLSSAIDDSVSCRLF